MKWILNTYKTCDGWNVDRIVDVCLKTGHTGVEFLLDRDQGHGIEVGASKSHIEEAGDKIRRAGLIIGSLTTGARFDAPEAAERSKNVDHAKRVIDMAVEMGVSQVRVLGDKVPENENAQAERFDNIAEALDTLADHAAPHGVTVSQEMHSDFSNPDYSVAVMERVTRGNVGLVFNCFWRVGNDYKGWSLPQGSPSIKPLYDYTRKYWTNVHTHDISGEGPVGHWPYYRELFRLLKEDGYDGPVSNECAYTGPDPEKVLRMFTLFFHACIAD